MTNEYQAQNALGTLKIYEIRASFLLPGVYIRSYKSERWVRAESPAKALIYALMSDPSLGECTIEAQERTQEEADDWVHIGPYTLAHYRGSK